MFWNLILGCLFYNFEMHCIYEEALSPDKGICLKIKRRQITHESLLLFQILFFTFYLLRLAIVIKCFSYFVLDYSN